jgi:DNA-binding transcriptional ArsR family regulator
LFRSTAQFRLLGELFTVPGAEYTIGELVDRTGVPQATVSREVAALVTAGLLRRGKQGNRTLVSVNEDAVIAPELRSMLAKLYGPLATLRQALGQVEGIERAVVFGSFAQRWSGVPGPVPNDIDVLVIGDVDLDRLWTVAARLSRELGIEVNPVARTANEWADDSTGFAETVKTGTQLDVTPSPSEPA